MKKVTLETTSLFSNLHSYDVVTFMNYMNDLSQEIWCHNEPIINKCPEGNDKMVEILIPFQIVGDNYNKRRVLRIFRAVDFSCSNVSVLRATQIAWLYENMMPHRYELYNEKENMIAHTRVKLKDLVEFCNKNRIGISNSVLLNKISLKGLLYHE
jgi:hypothetical protein